MHGINKIDKMTFKTTEQISNLSRRAKKEEVSKSKYYIKSNDERENHVRSTELWNYISEVKG